MIGESLDAFEQARRLDRFNYKTHIEIARSLLLDADYAHCIESCDASIRFFEEQQLKNQLWHLFQIKGLALASYGDVELALDPLFRAYELNPNFSTKFTISQLQSGDDAMETLSDILQFAPAHIKALINLARIYFDTDQYEEAFDLYSRASMAAQRSFQKSPEAYFGIAFLLQHEEPEASLLKYRQLGQQFTNFNDGHAWANLAALFCQLQHLPAALTCAKRAFQLTKSDRIRCILGQIYLKNKDYLRAFQTMSYFASSEDADAKWVLGVAAVELGELKIGFSQLAKAGEYCAGAAACGLRYALIENDLELSRRFAKDLKRLGFDDIAERQQIFKLLKVLKMRVSGGSADDELRVIEQMEEEWENEEE